MENQPLKRRRAFEPSQPEVAAWIAEQMDATGEEMHSQILQAVRTVGRTQARVLCQKALQMKSEEGQDQPAGDLFLQLIKTEGVPKKRPAAPVFSVSVLARSIAEQLQETEKGPLQQITRIVHLLGEEQAQHFLQETLRIEAEGGMMLPNGSRRRTPGGVYFALVRSSLPNRVRRRVFSAKARSEGQPQEQLEPQALLKAATPVSQTPQPQPLVWNQRLPIIAELEEMKGRASTVKITVVGRPSRVSEQAGCVVTMLQATKFPDLPKGLPIPTNASTRYVLYISMKQWRKVAEAIKDEDDTLIVEGYPHLDAEAKHIAVFASSITTKKLQQALRQTQKVSE